MSTKALQVYLDDGDFRALEEWAGARGWTLSQAVRVALKALTRAEKPSAEDPLLAGSGMVDGLPPDLSERFDEYLGLTFMAEPAVRYDSSPPRKRPRKRVR